MIVKQSLCYFTNAETRAEHRKHQNKGVWLPNLENTPPKKDKTDEYLRRWCTVEGLGLIFSRGDVTERDVQREQVDRTAIIFDYFANHNQAGTMSPATGLNWASLSPIMMIVLRRCRKEITFFKNTFSPKQKLNDDPN